MVILPDVPNIMKQQCFMRYLYSKWDQCLFCFSVWFHLICWQYLLSAYAYQFIWSRLSCDLVLYIPCLTNTWVQVHWPCCIVFTFTYLFTCIDLILFNCKLMYNGLSKSFVFKYESSYFKVNPVYHGSIFRLKTNQIKSCHLTHLNDYLFCFHSFYLKVFNYWWKQ